MFSSFFGNYLLHKGVVSADQLSNVLENQKQIRLKLGVLAVHSNFMTSQQVNEIHQLQKQEDRRFGDLAIEKGYLTEEILMTLLVQQKSEHLLLAQSLIDEGLLTLDEFDHQIKAYIKDYSLTNEQFEGLKEGNIDVIIHAFTNFENSVESQLYSDFLSLFIKNVMRFVDSNIRLDRLVRIPYADYEHLFSQRIIGDKSIYTGYSGDVDALLTLASKFADEDFTELTEYAIDAACEFLNTSNGLYCVNKSNEGLQLDLQLQDYKEHESLKPSGNLYKIPIYLESGVLDLIIGTL